MAWDCRGTRRRWRNIWCPDRDAVAAAESIRVSRGSRGRARPAPFPHCPSRRFAGPAQNLGFVKTSCAQVALERPKLQAIERMLGQVQQAGACATPDWSIQSSRKAIMPIIAALSKAPQTSQVPNMRSRKNYRSSSGVCRPLNQSNAASNEARTTRAAASMSASTRRCNIGGAGLNNRHRTRRRAGGTPPAALPAGLQRSGQGRPRARPRRASRPR